jgi:RimJ/RimL family protein N-acetyltransferase
MTEQPIHGKIVTLCPATLEDRLPIYEWAAISDTACAMMGPPNFPDHPIPTWEEFCADYKAYFFDGSAPELGRCYVILVEGAPVGQVNYNDIDEREGIRRTELDIWIRAEQFCGKGYGGDALLALCDYLATQMNVREFMVQPSARNPRAIHAYGKAGFSPLPLTVEEACSLWGPSDYFDSVYMVKTLIKD